MKSASKHVDIFSARQYNIPVDHIYLIHDELDLLVGQYKLKLQGSAG